KHHGSFNSLYSHHLTKFEQTKRLPMNRRNFIYNTSLATSAALMGLKNAGPVKPAYKMGLQLFTVRKPLAEDLFGTIKQIAAIGYRDTETYGFDPAARSYYDMPAGPFRQLLSDN